MKMFARCSFFVALALTLLICGIFREELFMIMMI